MAHYSLIRPRAGDPWGGLGDLRREMDALLGRFAGGPGAARGVFPATNLYETGDACVLTAELPGVAPDDIEVSIEGTTVSIRGTRKIDYADAATNIHRLERQSGSFRRAFELPVAVEADKIEAVHKDGVLMLRMPKAPEHQPRRIRVQAS